MSFALSNAPSYNLLGNNSATSASPAYFSPTLASALFANQGSTSTILHGNAAGNPSWGAVSLTSDVTGVLPSSNGGTGVNNGTSTITLAGSFTTTGGNPLTFNTTGATNITLPTSGTIFSNPMSTQGAIIYGGVSGAPTT